MRRSIERYLYCFSSLALLSLASGCAYWRIDPNHVLIRSDVIESLDQEKEILSRARLSWTEDRRVRVLYISGTPYERGYQHGALLRKEVQANLLPFYKKALDIFHSEEIFAEAYERIRPHIPQKYVDEMHGLAHGSRIPLHVIHAIHALPSISEWGGKKRIKETVKLMISGDLGTSCSNLGASSEATADGELYTVRILDWGLHRLSNLGKNPLLTVSFPNRGIPNVNIGWIGFLGAVSGMNAEQITLGEMGYGDPPNETLRGTPMIFVLREVMERARSSDDVRKIIPSFPGDSSFVYLMTDGKTKESELYVRDPDRFEVFSPGQEIRDGEEHLLPIAGVSYGGHYDEKMYELLESYHGKITPQLLMDTIIPQIVMKHNFQNVVYAPSQLAFWVNNAADRSSKASDEPYTYFDFGAALKAHSFLQP